MCSINITYYLNIITELYDKITIRQERSLRISLKLCKFI